MRYSGNHYLDRGEFDSQAGLAGKFLPMGSFNMGDIAARVNIPGNDGRIVAPTQMDIPGVGEDQYVTPIGYFGKRFPEGHPALEYSPNPGISAPIRGLMNHIQGGIPIPAGTIYDLENSRQKWPTYFEGVRKDHMPAFTTPTY